MKKKLVPYLLLVPQILLTILFLVGLITGITQSFGVIPVFGLKEPTLHYYKEILTRPDFQKSVFYSLRIAFVSASLAAVLGTILAGVCTSLRQTEGLWFRVLQLPVTVSHVVVAIFIVNLCSQNGLLARMAYALGLIAEQQQFPAMVYDVYGTGIILAYLWKEIPFIFYFVIALMSNISEKLGEAAVNLGAGRVRTFLRVTLPLCGNSILSGFLIIFVFSLGAYELPLLLGATIPKALPVLAYQQYIHPDLKNRPYAMALNGIIILISTISALLYFFLMQKTTGRLVRKRNGRKEHYEEDTLA